MKSSLWQIVYGLSRFHHLHRPFISTYAKLIQYQTPACDSDRMTYMYILSPLSSGMFYCWTCTRYTFCISSVRPMIGIKFIPFIARVRNDLCAVYTNLSIEMLQKIVKWSTCIKFNVLLCHKTVNLILNSTISVIISLFHSEKINTRYTGHVHKYLDLDSVYSVSR